MTGPNRSVPGFVAEAIAKKPPNRPSRHRAPPGTGDRTSFGITGWEDIVARKSSKSATSSKPPAETKTRKSPAATSGVKAKKASPRAQASPDSENGSPGGKG